MTEKKKIHLNRSSDEINEWLKLSKQKGNNSNLFHDTKHVRMIQINTVKWSHILFWLRLDIIEALIGIYLNDARDAQCKINILSEILVNNHYCDSFGWFVQF